MDKTEQVTKIVRCYSCNVQPKGKECELFDRCSQYVEVQSILALIASEQKPMVEKARYEIGCAIRHLEIGSPTAPEVKVALALEHLHLIDAVLKGEGHEVSMFRCF